MDREGAWNVEAVRTAARRRDVAGVEAVIVGRHAVHDGIRNADVAVADAEGQFIPSAVTGEQSGNVERARIFIVATREGDTWRISQLRNMRRQGAGPSPR